MRVRDANGKAFSISDECVRFEGMTWALPTDDLIWTAKYGDTDSLVLNRHMLAFAAGCYLDLIQMPKRQRDKRIRDLRTALRLRLAAGILGVDGNTMETKAEDAES